MTTGWLVRRVASAAATVLGVLLAVFVLLDLARGDPASLALRDATRGGAPSSPNRWGMKTVKPASRTQRANRATWGLMPGISVITITAGPLPAT